MKTNVFVLLELMLYKQNEFIALKKYFSVCAVFLTTTKCYSIRFFIQVFCIYSWLPKNLEFENLG